MLRGTPEHPKTDALMIALGIGRAQAVGHLELLWHFAQRYAPAGDVGRWTDGAIETACAWEGEPGKLVEALVRCCWLDETPDHRLVVHDWHEHSDRYVKRKMARQGRTIIKVGRAPGGRSKGAPREPGGRPAGGPAGAGDQSQRPEPETRASIPPNPPAVDDRGSLQIGVALNGNSHDHDPNTPERLDPSGFLDAVKTRLAAVIPTHLHATWIRPLEASGWDGEVFVLEAPTEQHREWVRRNYAEKLKGACHELGQDCRVRIVLRTREPVGAETGPS